VLVLLVNKEREKSFKKKQREKKTFLTRHFLLGLYQKMQSFQKFSKAQDRLKLIGSLKIVFNQQ